MEMNKRTQKSMSEDRISTLTDEMIAKLLDLLTVEEAVRTGVLCKRWKNLWTRTSDLKYTYKRGEGEAEPRLKKFLEFVIETLMRHGLIRRLALKFWYERELVIQVHSVLDYARQKKVEELHLQVINFNHCHLPQVIYNISTLKKLTLSCCIFYWPMESVCWPLLTRLFLLDVRLANDVFESIFVGSPALEFLKVNGCEGFSQLNVTSKHLTKLVIEFYRGELTEFIPLEISAPNLRYLEILGHFSSPLCHLLDVSSLVEATLTFHQFVMVRDDELEDDFIKFYDLLWGLLDKLDHVKGLTIGGWGVEVLSIGKLKKWSYPSSERRQLTLHAYLSLTSLPGIASALQISPNLEKLVIHLIPESQTSDYITDFDPNLDIYDPVEETYLEEMSVFHCLSEHLKTVEIFGFSRDGTNDLLPGLLRFLLEKSMVLETMVIHKDAIHPANLMYVEEEILSFPKSSSQAIVRFQLAK